MPLRSSATSSAKAASLASPYSSPRRPSGQPRTSRMQYSACGACRMRRVRCDLKDQPYTGSGQPQCGNCTERGLRCVDEFADVKAVKLLRRGRRLQQVEAVYGKTADEEGLYGVPVLTPNLVAKLKPEFFSSNFFHRFFIQHPIIDPAEFLSRFFEFSKGNTGALGVAGQLIAMILVVWGVSFGVNEYGTEEPMSDPAAIRARRETTNEMVREILQLIDMHGILRKPSFDGVRAMLLLLPLTEDVQTPTERLVMYEMVGTHVHTLCNLSSLSSVGSGQNQAVDSLVRARVFWYTHTMEGITAGLRGGRFILSEEDIASFNKSLELNGDGHPLRPLQPLDWWCRVSSTTLSLAGVCRKIYTGITGPKVRLTNAIEEARVLEVWDLLDKAWDDFDSIRQLSRANVPIVVDEDVTRFCDGWQIFIFECLIEDSRIRDALRQRGLVNPASQHIEAAGAGPVSSQTLLERSKAHCGNLARKVMAIVKRHIVSNSQFFEYDSTLARDGCFYAAFLLAGENGTKEEVECGIQALKRMRWAFSNSQDRASAVAMAWSARTGQTRHSSPSSSISSVDSSSNSMSLLESHSRPIPSPLAIPSFSGSGIPGFSDITFNSDSRLTTPPGSACSSKHSLFEDMHGHLSTESSPGSSRRVSTRGSPVPSGFVTPALLHSMTFSHSPSGRQEDIAHLPSPQGLFFGGDDMPSYQLHSTQSSSHIAQSSPTTMSLRPLPGSPHALISGTSPQTNLQDIESMYHVAPMFDHQTLTFSNGDSSNAVPGISDLGSAFPFY